MKEENAFELFVLRLEKGVRAKDSYESLCRELGLDPVKLDGNIRETLGTEGIKVVECYKFDIPLWFL